MFACTFALTFAALAEGLGEAVTVVVELALALLFEFTALLQATPKRAKANKVRKPVVRRISVLLSVTHLKKHWGQFRLLGLQLTHQFFGGAGLGARRGALECQCTIRH
jgi:hypothetical protein